MGDLQNKWDFLGGIDATYTATLYTLLGHMKRIRILCIYILRIRIFVDCECLANPW